MIENLSALSFISFQLNAILLKYKQNHNIDVIYRKITNRLMGSLNLENIVNEAVKSQKKLISNMVKYVI